MEKETELESALQSIATNNFLTCTKALELARTLKVSPELVGTIANKLKIKIKACQLGCFK